MIMMTMHKRQIRGVLLLCALAVLVGAGIWVGTRTISKAVTTSAGQEATTDGTTISALFAEKGIQADAASATVTRVTIPKKWDDDFTAFHEVVQESGLNLKKVRGKTVDKWLLLCPALTNESVKTYAVALVYKEKPVGLYLLQKPSGNVLALTEGMAQQTAAPLDDSELQAGATFGTVELVDENAMPTE